MCDKWWNVKTSSYANNAFNPIRQIVDNLQITPHPEKPLIALSIGDPTVFGNLKPAKEITDAVVTAIQSGKFNGYAPSTGYVEAREAVARYCSVPGVAELEAKDIVLCSGCSCALDLCITALCSPGQNILVPRPGFPIYKTLAEGLSISTKHYDLLPEKNWEADLVMLEDMIDENTAAIVVNNPSNPCGSVFSTQHQRDILQVASRNKVPIIADEIYEHFVFEGLEYQPMASLTEEVPVLSCSGLTKRFLVPGWRMGWIAIYDRGNVFDKVRHALQSLSQRIIGSNTIVQGALPTILVSTPKSFFSDTISQIQSNAKMSYNLLKEVPGLRPVMPQGAMYMMVGVDMAGFQHFSSDLEFVETMIREESVFCLPGKCFDYHNYVRLVLTVPGEQLREACTRIASFCSRHYRAATTASITNNDVVVYKQLSNGQSSPEMNNGSFLGMKGDDSLDANGHEGPQETMSFAKVPVIEKGSLVSEIEAE
nr:tyrosine aminotransferase-like [Cherax quadricarinatus]